MISARLVGDQPPKISKAVGASLKRLGAGGIDGVGRVLLDQSAQTDD